MKPILFKPYHFLNSQSLNSQKIRTFLFFIILLFSFSNVVAQQTISKSKLLKDFDYAVHEFGLMHQGFYNYVDKSTTDEDIEILRNSIGESMTKLEFYQLLRQLLGLMNEGHGSIKLPKPTLMKTGITKSFLPLGVKFCGKDLIVTQNFGMEVEGLIKGSKLVAINGETIPEITENLMPFLASDGFNETSKFEWIGGVYWSLLYRLVYGERATFELEVIAPNSKQSELLEIPAIRFTAFKSKNAKFRGIHFEYNDFTFKKIDDSIAYLCIPGFGADATDYQKFYKDQFRKIDSLNIKHLIIDIQANTGGEEGNENLLFSYLSNERIKKYKKVTMLPKPYHKNKNDEAYQFDKWELKGTIAERGEFTLYSDYYSELGYARPDKEYVYQNNLYVLTSGLTFSGGAEFASMIKMTNRAIFIGDETGGAYEGNVSGYSETIKLPNTKIKFSVPTVHFQIDVSPKIKGRGILPDYEVPQTSEDYLANRNSKLEFALGLIKN